MFSPAAIGVSEAVRHRREGLVVPARDVRALADALHTLYSDEALRRRLGRAARERVKADFSLADQLDTLTGEEWDRPSLCDGWRSCRAAVSRSNPTSSNRRAIA